MKIRSRMNKENEKAQENIFTSISQWEVLVAIATTVFVQSAKKT